MSIVGSEIESSFPADQSLLYAKLSKMNVSKVRVRQRCVSTVQNLPKWNVGQMSIVGAEIESSFPADQSLLWAKLSKMNKLVNVNKRPCSILT